MVPDFHPELSEGRSLAEATSDFKARKSSTLEQASFVPFSWESV